MNRLSEEDESVPVAPESPICVPFSLILACNSSCNSDDVSLDEEFSLSMLGRQFELCLLLCLPFNFLDAFLIISSAVFPFAETLPQTPPSHPTPPTYLAAITTATGALHRRNCFRFPWLQN